MQVVENISQMQNLALLIKQERKTIGFVPTMGFLHAGHLSLINIMRTKCDVLITSIFVNPTQFSEGEDFKKYPRDFERDEKLCKEVGVNILFYPKQEEIYPDSYLTYVDVSVLTNTMCGKSRPGHFRGVTTIVCKLFNIVKPDFAIFGQKDYQQALVISKMAKDLNFDVEILTAPIVREADGLALSSRNKYLSVAERKSSLCLYDSLKIAAKFARQGVILSEEIRKKIEERILNSPGTKIDYIAIVDPQSLQPVTEIKSKTLVALAVYVGRTRLIDNILLEVN